MSLIQTGGRYLGQGVSGCTFVPAPRCAGESVFVKSDTEIAGKLTSDNITDELKIGKAIMALPLAKQYFALPTAGCRAAMPITDPDVKHCRVITEAGEGTKFSVLLMPMGGIQLGKYAQDHERLASHYIRILIHLLEGAVIYQNAGYVHNDIKGDNILVDGHNVARFIDFGLAFRLSDIKVWDDANLGRRFRPEYGAQPPEIHAWRMQLNKIRIADGVQQLMNIHREYEQLEHAFPQRKDAIMAIVDFMDANRLRGGEFVRTYGKGFDSWRIGLCMWKLWYALMQWSPIRDTALYENREIVRKVLGGLTEFDPRKRLSVGDALRLISEQA